MHKENCQIILSKEDQIKLVKILQNPPKPTKALKKAFKLYEKMIKEGTLVVED